MPRITISSSSFSPSPSSSCSPGTVGAQVLDVYGVIVNATTTLDNDLKAINGTLLPPIDPKGAFFGVMTFCGNAGVSPFSIELITLSISSVIKDKTPV